MRDANVCKVRNKELAQTTDTAAAAEVVVHMDWAAPLGRHGARGHHQGAWSGQIGLVGPAASSSPRAERVERRLTNPTLYGSAWHDLASSDCAAVASEIHLTASAPAA